MSRQELAPFIQALRGRGGAALAARVTAHPLAPAGQPAHRYQLAMILATARPSAWRPAAEIIARAWSARP